jgi:hypothetical protein
MTYLLIRTSTVGFHYDDQEGVPMSTCSRMNGTLTCVDCGQEFTSGYCRGGNAPTGWVEFTHHCGCKVKVLSNEAPTPASVQEHYWRAYTTYLLAQPDSELEKNMRAVLELYSALWPLSFPKGVPHEKEAPAAAQ